MVDYALPSPWPLPPSRGHVYRPLAEPASLGPLGDTLSAHATYDVAMKLAAPPTHGELTALLGPERRLALWAADVPKGARQVASCVVSTVAADWHVAAIHHGPFQAARHAELIETLSDALFNAHPELTVVWTAAALPEAPGMEEALTSLGFTQVPSDLDGGRRVTYGLFRHIWSAYRAT